MTTSNSYRFVWNDAAINRDTNNLVSAALELFRNGDIAVATNGVAAYLPRELPFPHAGFGQYFRGQAPRKPDFSVLS